MLRLRIIHRLRTTLFLVVLGLILAAVGTLLWANYTGMPKSWRQAVERGIAQHGIHVEIGGLSYNPLQGIVARQVKVYASEDRKQVISILEGIILDLDNAKLAKGQIQLARVKLSKARLVLPVDPDDPDAEVLKIDNIQGEFIPPGNPHIEVRNARGMIEGIEIVLNAKIADDLPESTDIGGPGDRKGHRDLLAKIIRELREWSFDAESPPQIRIQCVGKRSEMDQLKASIQFKATAIGKNLHTIERMEAEAELHENLLSVHSLKASNGKRRLTAHLDYELDKQRGRFDFKSSLEIPELLHSWFGMKTLSDIMIAGDQDLSTSGEFHLIPGSKPHIHATGKARCEFANYRGIRFDQLESDFAWRNGDLFLKDLSLVRPDGRIEGKVLMEGDLVRLDLHSTLLPAFYRPMFESESMLAFIDDFTTTPDSFMELHLEGGFDRKDPSSWAYAGKGTLRDIAFRGVAFDAMQSDLSVSSSQMDFTNGSIVFDYSNYPMRQRFKGPEEGRLNFKSVRYRRAGGKQLSFEGLDGTFWPAPTCRLFLTQTADHLEQYGFHHPPVIRGSGTVDLEHRKDTRIELEFSSEHSAEYKLLDAPVSMRRPNGRVIVTDDSVDINDLKLGAFDGSVLASLKFPKDKPMSIELKTADLSMDAINSTYGMNMKCGGQLTGAIDFKMKPGEIDTMQGKGNLKLVKAELFSVPIFGPLSHVLQTVLSDKRVGAERAKEASCTFLIQNGVMASNDFQTTTTSLIFAGDGWVDLDKRTMDMTMRLNARGLLGLLTIPLRPFYGLFQFRGTGPLKNPEWKRVMFTKPQEEIHELLLKTPTGE